MLFSHWPIRNKLQLGLGLLAVSVLTLFGSAYYGLYAYRSLVKSLSARSAELPLADKLRDRVGDLHGILNQVADRKRLEDIHGEILNQLADRQRLDEFHGKVMWEADSLLLMDYRTQLESFRQTLDSYKEQLAYNSSRAGAGIGDDTNERKTLAAIDVVLQRIEQEDDDGPDSFLENDAKVGQLRADVDKLHGLVAELPGHLHARFRALSDDVRIQYRWAIVLAWCTAGLAGALLVAAVQLFRKWIARPLATLVHGSREVAAGKFDTRIRLDSSDEMGELAEAMNAMMSRFQEIRDDLDRQVRERTKQVVRGEQLASVGFLAAGVAHEINNPLASIAMCSESLEARLGELLEEISDSHAADREVVRSYLQMIQKEAFRCKQITEKLLDFSRMGDSERRNVDLRELVSGVTDMIRHLGKYQNKSVVLRDGDPIIAEICPQEIKQVVLNLITNALDSVDSGGTVTISVTARDGDACIEVKDNGCGMTDEVIRHLFEPFFTRRRGGEGIGLGLSITYRIVEEHGGQIVPHSDGAGRGSKFTVTLPLHHPVPRRSRQPLAA